MTRGILIWMTEIHFGSPGSGKTKTQISLTLPCAFTQSCGSDDTWLLLINDSDPFRAFGTSPSATSQLRKICFGFSSGLRCFDPSGFLSTSHFKSPKAHFPEGLDQLPPVPFKINDSYSLRGLFLWCYTSHKFSLRIPVSH
jgi:hypothetical protein